MRGALPRMPSGRGGVYRRRVAGWRSRRWRGSWAAAGATWGLGSASRWACPRRRRRACFAFIGRSASCAREGQRVGRRSPRSAATPTSHTSTATSARWRARPRVSSSPVCCQVAWASPPMASSHSFKTPPPPPRSVAGMNAIVYPTYTYRDARAAIDWLGRAFGFESLAVPPPEGEEVAHPELALDGPVIMPRSEGAGDPRVHNPPGSGATYVATDEIAARAEVIRPLSDTDYGSREFSVRDPEGNIWSFGTYRVGDG